MIFLPIVTRELRVAARRKTTFIIRCAVALIGIVIGGFLLFMFEMVGPTGLGGAMVFLIVSRYTLFLALLGGIFLASDCVSEERREGTLGFLFLTDLKGYDVVLGKFTAVSLNAFYGLLAVFPVLALSMLAGGVTAGEFWRTCLTLANTLFVSVAAAIWMSSISKSTYRAMSGAICLLLLLTVTAVVADEMSSAIVKFSAPLFYIAALSPLTSYHLASAANYLRLAGSFWGSLVISNAAGWLFLGLAGWRLSVFTEKAANRTGWRRVFTGDLLAMIVGKTERRSGLLSINPVLWILDDSRRMRVLVWAIAIISGALLLTATAFDKFGAGTPFLNHYLSWPCYFLLKVFFTIQACRFFSESRRAGALELLCCTPMTMKEIIKGQWMALRRIFLWPVLVLIFCQLACFCFSSSWVFSSAMPDAFIGAYTLYQMVRHVADFFAAGWFGMWLALTIRKPNAAAGLTILYVLVLPTVIFCVPTLATDAVFIVIGIAKLRQDFRIHHLNWVAPQPG